MLKEKLCTFLNINILQKKQLLKFFCIFFVLIIIPVMVSSAIIYYNSIHIIEDEIKEFNNTVMNNMISRTDEELYKIKLSIAKFSIDNDLKLTLNTGGLKANYVHEYKNVMGKLAKLDNSNLEFSEVFIYYMGTDFILSREGSYDFEFYFNKANKFGDYNAEYWKEYLSFGGDFDIISTQEVTGLLWEMRKQNKMIAIKTSLPFYSTPNAAIVIFIDENCFKNTMVEYGNQGGVNYIVSTKAGDVITRHGESNILNEQKLIEQMKQHLDIEKNNFKYYDENEAFSITYNTAHFVEWVYIAAVPFKEISKQSRYIQSVTLYVVIVFLIIGIFTAFWLGKKQYKPIASLVEYLHKLNIEKEEKFIKKKYNEFNFISNQVDKIVSANESLKNSFSEGMPFLKENLFYRILNGNILSKSEIREELKKYDIEFTKNTFKVIIIKFAVLNGLDYNKENKGKGQLEFLKIKNNIFHIISAMFTKNIDYYRVEIDIHNTAYIVNFNENDSGIIMDTCNAVADFFNQDEYQVRLTIGVGSQCYDMDEIQDSFSRAMKATELRTISKKSEITVFNDELAGRNKTLFEIFDANIKTISNSFLSGNYKESRNLSQKMLDKCVEEGLTYNELEKIMYMLTDCLFYIIGIKGYKSCNYALNEKDIYERMGSFYTIEEYKRFVNEIFIVVEQQLKEQGNWRKDKIVNFIVNYVNDNYTKDIYLETIAGEMGMTSNYLSHFFKEYMKVSFSDFLGKVRVEKAKEMIRTTNKPINSICFEVGYINVNSFIRSFKKIEGITPGRYRDITLKSLKE